MRWNRYLDKIKCHTLLPKSLLALTANYMKLDAAIPWSESEGTHTSSFYIDIYNVILSRRQHCSQYCNGMVGPILFDIFKIIPSHENLHIWYCNLFCPRIHFELFISILISIKSQPYQPHSALMVHLQFSLLLLRFLISNYSAYISRNQYHMYYILNCYNPLCFRDFSFQVFGLISYFSI